MSKPRYILTGLIVIGIALIIGYRFFTRDWHFKLCLSCEPLSPVMSMLVMPVYILFMVLFAGYLWQSAYKNWKSNCEILLDEDGLSVINAGDRENPEDFIAYTAIYRVSSIRNMRYSRVTIMGITLDSDPHSKIFLKDNFDSIELFDDFVQELTKRTGHELQDIPQWQRRTSQEPI